MYVKNLLTLTGSCHVVAYSHKCMIDSSCSCELSFLTRKSFGTKVSIFLCGSRLNIVSPTLLWRRIVPPDRPVPSAFSPLEHATGQSKFLFNTSFLLIKATSANSPTSAMQLCDQSVVFSASAITASYIVFENSVI